MNPSRPPYSQARSKYPYHHTHSKTSLSSASIPNTKKPTELFCNNCGKYGHLFHICKIPITSIGIICFRVNKNDIEFLMIRRKDTLGYIDFTRGKFSIQQKTYILNMIHQMTTHEKELLLKKSVQVKKNENNVPNLKERIVQLIHGVVREDGESYDLESLIAESNASGQQWEEPEWGFPKGRRNAQESDFECALREFSEETGYSCHNLKNIRNVVPFEEVFTGSNYNSYRHKYYLMYIPYEVSICNNNFQKSEVSKMEWKSLPQCLNSIRPYNLEKRNLIHNVYNCLKSTLLFSLHR